MNSGFTFMATACGVTPQAQKTGTSPGLMVEGSPNSGLLISLIPMALGSPMWRGAPCTEGIRLVTCVALMAFFGVMGRMETTMGPLNTPAGTHWILVMYMGTL